MASAVEYVTVDEYVDRLGFGSYQWRLLFISGLAWASDAGEVMLLSFLGPAAICQWPDTSPGTEAAITTVVFVGMAVGTLIWGRIADFFGRKQGVIISGFVTVLSGLASAFSPSVGWLIVMRMMTGAGIGGVPIVFSMYLELVPTETRGFWASLIQVWWSVGTMGVAAVAWAILESPGWRWLVGVVSIPLALLTVLYWFLAVESPRYFVDQGLIGRAEETLRVIAAINGKADELGHLRLRDTSKALAAHSPLLAPGDDAASSSAATDSASKGEKRPGMDDTVLVKSDSLTNDAAADTTGAGGIGDVPVLHTPAPSARSSRSQADSLCKDTYGSFDHGEGADIKEVPGGRAHPSSAERALEVTAPSSGRGTELGMSCGACVAMVATTGSALSELVTAGQLRTSLLLWMLWFSNALGYYGLVLLSTEIRLSAPSNDGKTCRGEQVHLSNDDFLSIFIDSAAELPGLILAALIADRLGRRRSQALGFGVAALACGILVFIPAGAQLAETMLLFVARAFVLMAFTITYLYTPEVYAQHLRALGVAVANAFARVGGMIAPLIGQSLVQSGQVQVTEIVFAVVCALAMVCALLIQVETSGASLGAPKTVGATSGGPNEPSNAGRHPGRGTVSSDLMLDDEAVDLAADCDVDGDSGATRPSSSSSSSAAAVSSSYATGSDDADGISLPGTRLED